VLDSTDLNPLGMAKAIVNMIDPAGSRPAPHAFPLEVLGRRCVADSREYSSEVQQQPCCSAGAGVSTVSHPRSNDLR
jgi:hypothetical protein